jgi:hypothetical protein
VTHRRAFVDDLDVVLLEMINVLLRLEARRLNDPDAPLSIMACRYSA